MLQELASLHSPAKISHRSYIVPDSDPVEHRGIQEIERDIIFAEDTKDLNLSFMHNDVSLSNCIVDNDKIAGLIDWEMAGGLQQRSMFRSELRRVRILLLWICQRKC
jgi:aminoglycoside phosphotransferase